MKEIEEMKSKYSFINSLQEDLQDLSQYLQTNRDAIDRQTKKGTTELTNLVNKIKSDLEATIIAAGQAETKLKEILDKVTVLLQQVELGLNNKPVEFDAIRQQNAMHAKCLANIVEVLVGNPSIKISPQTQIEFNEFVKTYKAEAVLDEQSSNLLDKADDLKIVAEGEDDNSIAIMDHNTETVQDKAMYSISDDEREGKEREFKEMVRIDAEKQVKRITEKGNEYLQLLKKDYEDFKQKLDEQANEAIARLEKDAREQQECSESTTKMINTCKELELTLPSIRLGSPACVAREGQFDTEQMTTVYKCAVELSEELEKAQDNITSLVGRLRVEHRRLIDKCQRLHAEMQQMRTAQADINRENLAQSQKCPPGNS